MLPSLALFVALVAAEPLGHTRNTPTAATAGDGLCAPSGLANSNRNSSNPCQSGAQGFHLGWASTGTECAYSCNAGFVPIGRHVCQWHDVVKTNATTGEKQWDQSDIEHGFWGGRCQRLCSNYGEQACRGNQSVRRYRDVDDDGECFSTMCFSTGLDNLENVARGVYEVVTLSRDEKTGYYRDSTGEFGSNQNDTRYSLDATGMGMMAEAVACELGYQSVSDGLDKVIRTVGSLLYTSDRAGEFKRDPRGFFSHYSGTAQKHSSPMATGLAIASALFVKNYFTSNAAANGLEAEAFSLSTMVDALYGSVDFTQILCDADTSLASPTGTGIPFTMSLSKDVDGFPGRCGDPDKPHSVQYPELGGDEMYQFNEEHNAVHLAYQQACGGQTPGECDNEAIELMWNRWQVRARSKHLRLST